METCKICGKEYKRKVTDVHLENEHGIGRDEYDILTQEDIEEQFEEVEEEEAEEEDEEVDEEVDEEPESDDDDDSDELDAESGDEESPEPEPETETISQTPSPSDEEDEPEEDEEPGGPYTEKKLWQVNPRAPRNRRFYDRESGWWLDRQGRADGKKELPDELTLGIQTAIERGVIVPVED